MVLTEQYFSSVRGLCQLPKPQRLITMLDSVRRAPHVGLRNRLLYDAVKLIEHDRWDAQNDACQWTFENIGELKLSNKWKAELGENLVTQLELRIAELAEDTSKSFAEFKSKPIPAFATVEDFLDWFYTNLPYATLGLGLEDQWCGEAEARIRWMLDQCPDDFVGKVTRSMLLEHGVDYVFKWLIPRSPPQN